MNSARTVLLVLVGASPPSFVRSGRTAARIVLGNNACCATAAAEIKEDSEPALATVAATGQAGSRARANHATTATAHTMRFPGTHSRDLTAATVKTPIAQPLLYTNQSRPCPLQRITTLTCALVNRTVTIPMRANLALSGLVTDASHVVRAGAHVLTPDDSRARLLSNNFVRISVFAPRVADYSSIDVAYTDQT